MIRFTHAILLLSLLVLLPACATVDVKPIKVEPIHVVVDINLRVDRQLDQFFAFEDQFADPATQPAGAAPTASPAASPMPPGPATRPSLIQVPLAATSGD